MSNVPAPREDASSHILLEVIVLWLVVNLLIRAAKLLYEVVNVHEAILIVVPVLFMYGPVVSCRLRGADSNRYPITLPSFRERSVWRDVWKYNALLIGVITPPFLVVYHLWHTQVLGFSSKARCRRGHGGRAFGRSLQSLDSICSL